MAIDTLGYADYLEAHGYTRDQAKAQATAANQFLFPQFATKGDLRDLEHRLTIRVGGIVAAIAGLSITISKLL